MKPRSLRLRLTLWYAAILGITFAAAGFGVWWTIRVSIHNSVDEDLRSRLQTMRLYIKAQEASRESSQLAEELAEQSGLAPTSTLYQIVASDGHWIYRSPGTLHWNSAPPDVAELPEAGETRTLVLGGGPVRVLTAAVPVGTVQIGVPVGEFYEMLDDFSWTAFVASPVLLLIASLGGYWMAGRALAPVDRITRTAARIEAQNLSERLPVSGSADELDRLSTTLNLMFTRLEAAFHRITQFTADASHELRTPLAVIRTTAEVAKTKSRTEAQYSQALDRILVESERTTSLIEDLMLLARADASADDLTMEPVNIASLIGEACVEANVLAETKGVRLVSDPLPNYTVLGDDHALHRLFLILLDNAIKFSPIGGEVRVSAAPANSAGKTFVIVDVRDNGPGIAPEDLPHIFERFYRTSKDRSRKTGGSGLGLSIARWIAERHAGEIIVESELRAGSLFRVRIPIQV